MRKVRELLRFCIGQNMSARQGAKIAGLGKTAASQYISGFKSSGLTLAAAEALSDSELLAALNLKKETENTRFSELSILFPYFIKELKRTGVTLQILWEEYLNTHPQGYAYSQFCHHYFLWRKEQKVSMRMEHKAGDKMYVDFAGSKLCVTNQKTGEIIEYEVFVSVLGASQLSYIEAVPSQTKADWIAVNQAALRFYGGVPAAIVPDCLKSAVIKADKYEPQINESFEDFARHYNTAIVPARALHPKDKALAENFVRSAYTQIYARIRNQIFYSVEELNLALWEHLDTYNKKNFQGRDHSRQQLFDEIEKQELKPLPIETYELKSFCECKVQYNHHIYLKEDFHYYSVPFILTGKIVRITYTNRLVEIYYDNQRLAMHQRSRLKYGYSTKDEHRPKEHSFMLKWTPERFIEWASKISPETQELVTHILDSRPHPEQAYRSCMGILNLEKTHPKEDYIKACQKALTLECYNYNFIKNTLKTKAFNLNDEDEPSLFTLPKHDNIRGKEMFN